MDWPADQVERWPLERLVPYARNARTHSEEQVAQLAASIREWGWTVPVLVAEDGTIIAGHGRVMAARRLGVTTIPVMVARGWTEAQRRAYALADNKLALNAGWDEDLLRLELGDLKALDFDLGPVGFSDEELANLLLAEPAQGNTDPDALPDAPATPVTKPGDVWLLGQHRLMCGDSTSAENIATLMEGDLADLCFTSPPYGQQRDYASGGISDWDVLMRGVCSALPLKPDAQLLVNLGLVHRDAEWQPYWDAWIAWMRSEGWRRFGWYVWDQGPGLPGDWNGRLAPAHEFIFHFNRAGTAAERARKTKASKWAGHANHGSGLRAADGTVTAYTAAGKPVQAKKIPDSVVRVMRHKARGIEVGHPAVFPVELVAEMLTAFSDPGDVVFEPFGGSGTQIIAAEQHGRQCRAMELAPEYCDIAVRRWQLFTGRIALLEQDGSPFTRLEAEAA